MPNINIKECKLLELQITQTRHPLSILQKKMSKFMTPKSDEKSRNVYKIRGAQLQCIKSHYANFKYKGKKTV